MRRIVLATATALTLVSQTAPQRPADRPPQNHREASRPRDDHARTWQFAGPCPNNTRSTC